MLRVHSPRIIAILALSIPLAAHSITFSDGDFATGWEDSTVVADNPSQSGTGPGTSTGSISRVATGGNPGAFRQHDLSVVQGDRVFTVGINRNAIYDPGTSGAIASLDLSIDLIFDPSSNGSNAAQLVLEQDSVTYFSPFLVFSQKVWTSHVLAGLTAVDFETTPNTDTAGLPGIHPDFSALGSPIFLGYAVGAGSVGTHSTPLAISNSADNWLVTVNPVPEPTTALLLGLGLAALGLRRIC